jgi:hypothetical protein
MDCSVMITGDTHQGEIGSEPKANYNGGDVSAL